MKKISHGIYSIVAAVLLTACGSDGGVSAPPAPVTSVSGSLVDARVAGVSYTCAPSSTSGVTDTQGTFTCRAGDDVTFKIGNATLGTVAAQSGIITPYDLYPNNHAAAINIARLLQSIDSDPSDDVITPNTTLVAAIPNLNFELDFAAFETSIRVPLLAVDASFVLVSAIDAQTTMNTAITDEGETLPVEGHDPIAVAGADQNVVTGATVTLNGASSSDADGDTLTYSWSWQERPVGSTASFSSTTDASVTFVPDVQGAYVAKLIVNDGIADSSADTVTITANSIPVANAGPDQNVNTGTVVTFDGSASADPTNDPLSYSWSTVSVPTGSTVTVFAETTIVNPTITPDVEGDYVFSLIVDDGTNVSSADEVVIHVTTPPSVETGFSPGWLAGKTLYQVIYVENNYLLVSMLYENDKEYIMA